MALWDRVTQFLALQPWQEPQLQTRSDDSSISDLIARFNVREAVWRPASIRSAMSVPAIFRSVAFISNTVGTLSLEAFRNGVKLAPEDRPRVIVRPDPFQRPREFFRDTAYNIVTRGESWWWVAKRDTDGSALSVLNVPPHEVTVTERERDLRFPIIEWRGREMPNDDMVQITFLREPGELRGKGPLQMCDAAVSVAVEAQEWAANFYAEGGKGGTLIKSASPLGQTPDGWSEDAATHEADIMRAQWVARAHNTVRVIDPSIDSVEEHDPNEAGAQMLESRGYQVGEAVRMIGVPASILAYGVAGTSLTYQNVGQELDKFTRITLVPDYLEPIEQAMSDLLTRSTVARFNLEGLRRNDAKTRWEIYEIAGKVIGQQAAADLANEAEGLTPGDIERAPVPFSVPQAVPTSLPIQTRSLHEVRCPKCARLVGRVSGPAELFCRHCKEQVAAA